jgi:hypothetical protein
MYNNVKGDGKNERSLNGQLTMLYSSSIRVLHLIKGNGIRGFHFSL